jgi:hypothetical protein
MNPSHSPTLSTDDPLRNPSKAAQTSSDRSSGRRASDSFNALYHHQKASFDDSKQTKDININILDNKNKKTNEDLLDADEPILRDQIDENPALAEQDLAGEDQTFETELLHGISVALSSTSSKKEVGGEFPLGGKELPLSIESLEQDPLLTSTNAESELEEVLAGTDNGIEIRGRSDLGQRSDRLRQDNVGDLNSIRSDLSINKHRLEPVQSRAASEPLTESLSALASLPLQDATTTLTAGNSAPTSLAAVVSQIDSTAAQKLSLAADAAANTDLNANTRSSNFDRSSALGEKIHWMHNAKISTAELHLHPAELGSIEIKIVTEDQQARVSFVTASATARDVIEESLPKLRELLADSGLALDQSDISQKESGDGHTRKDQQTLPQILYVEREMEHEFTASPISPRIGQIDHYV